MQKQRWDAAMQVENIRTSKTKGTKTRKNTSKMDRDLDYAPLEDRLIVTYLGKEKYVATPESSSESLAEENSAIKLDLIKAQSESNCTLEKLREVEAQNLQLQQNFRSLEEKLSNLEK
ncbi:hypothetical protein C5167_047686 [Papaver somniferum]|uniref:Uncharacterized protein n=1 Tax=Papaver somniferum TaxID=3469 RepID=A0A4Y7LLD8_PAPSO|nr:hypothetical protein C5167_047686 [Papaver somniferum]